VTRKITRAVSRIVNGLQDRLYLGNLNAKRDWGHAKDFVKVMWMILQAEKADDWVISTGVTTSVRDFVRLAFQHVGIEIEFKGKGIDEIGVIASCKNDKYKLKTGTEIISVDKNYFRPTEVDLLIGDSSKAIKELNWKLEYSLGDLVSDMMTSDLLEVESIKS